MKGRRWQLLASPFRLTKVWESCQGILTKGIYQRGTVSLRVRPDLISRHHLTIGREQPVGGLLGHNPSLDFRVQQLGPLVIHSL